MGQIFGPRITHRVTLSHPVSEERPSKGEISGKVTDVIPTPSIFTKMATLAVTISICFLDHYNRNSR